MQSSQLLDTLRQGYILAGSTKSTGKSDLEGVLTARLSEYYHIVGMNKEEEDFGSTLEAIQLRTAGESLLVLEQVQDLVSKGGPSASSTSETKLNEYDAPEELLGTRDLAQLRTLLSLVFKWAVEPLLSRIVASIPSVAPGGRRRTEVNIIDLTTVPEDYKLLSSILHRICRMILPLGVHGPPSATHITSALLDRHLADLVRPCMVLGWLPKSLSSESVLPLDDIRPVVVHLINMLPVSRSVTALSGVLSDPSALPYVRKACGYLMSRQILRRDGVRGLFVALFAEQDTSEESAPLEKLDNVAKLLTSIPTGLDEKQYFDNIVYQLLTLLSTEEDQPPAHRRAAAFSLSRMLFSESEKSRSTAARVALSALQRPFLEVTTASRYEGNSSTAAPTHLVLTPSQAIRTLQTLLTNTDPSPTLISSLLTPIIPPLYSLLWAVDSVKTSDPAFKTTIRGFLRTWGRLVDNAEGLATLWLIIDGEGGDWRVDIAGEVSRVEKAEGLPHVTMFTPEDLQRAEEAGEFDVDANILNLRPDPAHFVGFLKSIDRSDVLSELFVRLLETYREYKTIDDADPMRTLLYLQLIVQMQNQLSSAESGFDILKKPGHLLSFVKHALETAVQKPAERTTSAKPKAENGLKLEDLRIVDVEEDDEENVEGDSDDEDEPSAPREGSDEEMTSTALNLLLSILEANPDLNAQNAPVLDEVFPLLETLAKESSELIKPLAREARMVLTARLASSSAPSTSKGSSNKASETAQETYQKALKLLQDPILPVRAHGLLLLRELVSSRPAKDGSLQPPAIDRALVPGILSIFLQSLQDDDSYIFLNAVQGLSAMVDGFGRDVLKNLVDLFAKDLDGIGSTALTQLDVDTRTRVGEALGQVIKRCADALPSYSNLLIPPLFGVVRASHLPAALRTSALSLLAQCANTSAVAVLPYAIDLTDAMLDLLQVESVRAAPPQKAPTPEPPAQPTEGEAPAEKPKIAKQDAVAFEPTTKNAKVPTLRRSALYFLSLLTRAFAAQLDDVSTIGVYALPGETMRRAKTVVGYVAATDEDLVVRVMAKETLEGLDSLAEAMLGL